MERWIDVEKMYDAYEEYRETKPHFRFLPTPDDAFWEEYVDNAESLDRLFLRRYRHYRYFEPLHDSTQTWLEFRDAVEDFLIANRKRFSELYRINVLGEQDYDIFGNIDMTETKHGTMNIDRTETDGARSDSNTDTIGSRTDTSENEVSAFNSETYSKASKTTDAKGSQTNGSAFTKGAQTNTVDGLDTEDYTITKKGKMNLASNEDLIKKHIALWSKYEFITYIFKQIEEELLLI